MIQWPPLLRQAHHSLIRPGWVSNIWSLSSWPSTFGCSVLKSVMCLFWHRACLWFPSSLTSYSASDGISTYEARSSHLLHQQQCPRILSFLQSRQHAGCWTRAHWHSTLGSSPLICLICHQTKREQATTDHENVRYLSFTLGLLKREEPCIK